MSQSTTQPVNRMAYYMRRGTGSNSLAECIGGYSIFGNKNSEQQDRINGSKLISQSSQSVGIISQPQPKQQSDRNTRNQYVINVSEGSSSSMMTAGDIQIQRKSLSELTTQQSHLKELFRHTKNESLPFTNSPIKPPYHKKVDSLSLLTQTPMNLHNQSHQLLEPRCKTATSSTHTDEASQLFFKGANRQLFKAIRTDKSTKSQSSMVNKSYAPSNAGAGKSQVLSTASVIQQRYLSQLKDNSLVQAKFFDNGPFQSLVHGFAVNDTLLQNTEKLEQIQQQQQQSQSQPQILLPQQAQRVQTEPNPSPLFFTETAADKSNNNSVQWDNHSSWQDQEKIGNFKGEEKEEVMVLMLDLLREIEEPFNEGMSGVLYPRTDMIKYILEELIRFSNKAIKYLAGIGDIATCLCINTLLKMFAKIFSRQEARIGVEVKRRVDLEVEQTTLQLQFLKTHNQDLEDKLKVVQKEHEQVEKEFKEKVLRLEELKNEQTEIAEILKDQISDFRTKKYKDLQLEQIQHSSKEIVKQCAFLDAEFLKSKNTADESLLQLAKLAADKAIDIKQDPSKQKGFLFSGKNSPAARPLMQASFQTRASFSDQSAPIVFAEKYDSPENKAAFLFQHPFFFYLQPDISNCLYDRFLPKMTRPQIAGYLENFLDQEDLMRIGGTRLNAPTNFVAKVVQEDKDFFKATARIQEVCGLVKAALDNQKQLGFFFSNVFGIFQENMLTDSQFELILTLRKQLKENTPIFQAIQDQHFQSKLYEDEIYVTQKSLSAAFQNVFRSHPNFRKLFERFQLFSSTKRMQISQKAIQEQRKVGSHSLFSNESSSLVLVPNLMEKLKTENINDVLRSLDNIFEKLDIKNNQKVNYQSFKKLMNNHFGIETENAASSEYFKPFIEGENFNYIEFMNKITAQHVPEALNDKLIPYYVALNEVANILIMNQNQTFHDFKNKLSNILFSKETPALFSFSLIEDFFKDYEESRDNLLQYNTKRITPAILYQNLFFKNEWISLYNMFKSEGKIQTPNEEAFLKLYPKEELINNFSDYMEYVRHIYSFLLVQEKISIFQTLPPTETSIAAPSSNKLSRPKGLVQQGSTIGKIKSMKLRQDSTASIKSQPTNQGFKKSQFLMQPSIQQQQSERDRSDSQESVQTPVSTTKKSYFSQL